MECVGVTLFLCLADFGEGAATDLNQECRKRNKPARVDNEFGFAHFALEMSARKPGRHAQKATGTRVWNSGVSLGFYCRYKNILQTFHSLTFSFQCTSWAQHDANKQFTALRHAGFLTT